MLKHVMIGTSTALLMSSLAWGQCDAPEGKYLGKDDNKVHRFRVSVECTVDADFDGDRLAQVYLDKITERKPSRDVSYRGMNGKRVYFNETYTQKPNKDFVSFYFKGYVVNNDKRFLYESDAYKKIGGKGNSNLTQDVMISIDARRAGSSETSVEVVKEVRVKQKGPGRIFRRYALAGIKEDVEKLAKEQEKLIRRAL